MPKLSPFRFGGRTHQAALAVESILLLVVTLATGVMVVRQVHLQSFTACVAIQEKAVVTALSFRSTLFALDQAASLKLATTASQFAPGSHQRTAALAAYRKAEAGIAAQRASHPIPDPAAC